MQLIINLHFLHLSPTLLVIAVFVCHNTFLNNIFVKLQYANLEGSILVAEEKQQPRNKMLISELLFRKVDLMFPSLR